MIFYDNFIFLVFPAEFFFELFSPQLLINQRFHPKIWPALLRTPRCLVSRRTR
jgi:hypothetical protein